MNENNLSMQESDVLLELANNVYSSQRDLANACKHSLGIVNKCVNSLVEKGYIDDNNSLSSRAKTLIASNIPKRGIIMAAGFGMRMIPINMEYPKALIEVNGQKLIERLIRQLHAVNINEIYVLVGFMKEQFDYLIDDFGVKLIVCPEYATHNNLHSINRIISKKSHKNGIENILANAYIVPADIWCDTNPFRSKELYSWYMVSDIIDDESDVRINRKNELVRVSKNEAGNAMIGIAYLTAEDALTVENRVQSMSLDENYDNSFWETALYNEDKMIVSARSVTSSSVIEINTYEQLRDADSTSEYLKSDALSLIADVFEIDETEISGIEVLKKGMTNRSFLFSANDEKYIMRIPGEGTDRLIDRKSEKAVYAAISGKNLCDDPIYINPENGYKITKFLRDVRVADINDNDDLVKCMRLLRRFHEMRICVKHDFDLFGQIEFYQNLKKCESMYRDYETTRQHVYALKEFIDEHATEKVLTHIDAVPDNFLFYMEDGEEKLQLTDWEYSGMQDPHVDIAMFVIYSYYDRQQADELIDIYFDNQCDMATRIKIYCYIAACGLLWSNWSEYKSSLGIEFGEYGMMQYRYAKDFYKYAIDGMKELENE